MFRRESGRVLFDHAHGPPLSPKKAAEKPKPENDHPGAQSDPGGIDSVPEDLDGKVGRDHQNDERHDAAENDDKTRVAGALQSRREGDVHRVKDRVERDEPEKDDGQPADLRKGRRVGMFGEGGGWGLSVPLYTLGVLLGGISEKPIAVDGQVQVREVLSVTLSFDHDVVDGAPAARFAQTFKELVESGHGLGP